MPKTIIGTDLFREEAERRLIDGYELARALGLRSRQSLTDRVAAGTLPPPVYSRPQIVSLWDRDAIEFPTGKG